MKKIRVLHVGLDTHCGGIETYLMKISSNIDRSRFEFSFLAYDDEKPCFFNELSALGCKFHFVRSRRKSWFGNAKDIRNLLEKEKYDIIHCHLNSLTYITPALEGLKAGAKVIIHSRNGGSSIGSSSRILGTINRCRMPWDKVTCVAVSDLAGKWMFGKNRSFTVLNNGLDTSKYGFSNEDRTVVRKELSIPQSSEVIATVGAFRTQKNHSFIIDVFKEYHQKHKDSILLLVGEGELKEEIKRKVSENNIEGNVVFAGLRTDIPAVLSASDKYLFPSLYEGFPNALLEAETSGLLCVASTTITKQVCLDNCIRVSLDAPVSDWVTALEHPLVSDKSGCIEMVEKAGFGIKDEITRLENLYTSLVGGTDR